MARKVVSVVGAGAVGEHVALFCAMNELGDVRLFDIVDGVPQGKALDIMQAGPVIGYDSRLEGFTTSPEGGGYERLAGSDVVVVTAGFPRQPGMSRDDLLWKNFDIVRGVGEAVGKHAPGCFLVVVTNPLDVMVYTALRASRLPSRMVCGQAGILDSARYRTFLAMETGISARNISSVVLGGHGDDMVPSERMTTVDGMPIGAVVAKHRLGEIVQRTRDGGAEIVKLLKKGSAYYAPAAATYSMVAAYLRDRKLVAPCCVLLEGDAAKHYGAEGICVGVPVRIGAGGVEEVLRVDLGGEERELFAKTCKSVAEGIGKVREKLG
jgi:malate dehydrogenase